MITRPRVRRLQEKKLRMVLYDLARHKISIGKAAEICKVSIWEMLELVKKKNVAWTGYSKDDVERDINILR